MILTLILLVLGVATVYSFPLNITAISLGMFLIGVSILSIAIHIYFPPKPREVLLKVVETKEVKKGGVKRKRAKKGTKRKKK